MRSGHHSHESNRRYADAISPDRKESPAWQAWIEKQTQAQENAARRQQAIKQNALVIAQAMGGN